MATIAAPRICANEQLKYITSRLENIRGVVYASLARDGNRYLVSVVLSKQDDQAEGDVLDVQYAAIDQFPGSTFDFRVYDQRGRSASEIVGSSEESILDKTA
jgi:hypothetical protein